ncbi:MAG: sucrase ferredoxin [Acidimicrobiales bacterium]|nr:sucrase ferredoxin [Acidimicrobiales bacterium]
MELRCAPWTLAQGVDPVGSAARYDALLLVECPLPWPRDASEIPDLAAASARGGARVMAIVPRVDEAAAKEKETVRVTHHRRVGTNRLVGTDHRVAPDGVARLLDAILDNPLADSGHLPSAVGAAPAEVLVCGHGRRDACCGRWGTLLHAELAARGVQARVSRCSHTGGHRFAPTALTLPDGRAWAFVDADDLTRVVERTGDLAALLPHDRGTSALDPWAQVAERALFQQHGWAWLDHGLTAVTTEKADDRRSARVTLAWDAPDGSHGTAEALVEVQRVLPVPICGEPPEHATKTSAEYAMASLTVRSGWPAHPDVRAGR